MNDKSNDIIETLGGVRDKIIKKKRSGVGQCLICNQLTDDSDQFTCGNPQCDKELKQEMESRKEVLKLLGVKSLTEAAEKIRQIQTIADEIKSKL